MAWKWVENDSPVKPAAIDDSSSMYSVFVRKNFVKIPTQTDPGDPEIIIGEHWRYEEEIVSKDEWSSYYTSMINAANIDYIAMEVGVDL